MSGTLNVPNDFAALSGNVAASKIDADFSTVETYVNAREVTVGLVAARPVAGTAGRWYLATDVNGGTLYADNGTSWNQAGAGVNLASNTSVILSAQGGDSSVTGTLAETSLKSFSVPAGQLATNSDALLIKSTIRTSGDALTKQIRLKFGATTIADSTAVSLNNGIIWLEARVVRISPTVQRGTSIGLVTASAVAWTSTMNGGTLSTAPGETLSGAVTIDLTGQVGNIAATIACDYLSVEYVKAV